MNIYSNRTARMGVGTMICLMMVFSFSPAVHADLSTSQAQAEINASQLAKIQALLLLVNQLRAQLLELQQLQLPQVDTTTPGISKPTVPTGPYRDPVVTKGRASISVAYVAPYKVKVTATYNTIKDCTPGVIYNITYSDGEADDTFATDGTCSSKIVTTYHTFEHMQRDYSVGIEMYAVSDNAWSHFVQAAKLVRVNENGSMTIESNNPSTWKKG